MKTGKFGCVNRKGKVIVKPTYDFIDTFVDGLAQVEKTGNTDISIAREKKLLKFNINRQIGFQKVWL